MALKRDAFDLVTKLVTLGNAIERSRAHIAPWKEDLRARGRLVPLETGLDVARSTQQAFVAIERPAGEGCVADVSDRGIPVTFGGGASRDAREAIAGGVEAVGEFARVVSRADGVTCPAAPSDLPGVSEAVERLEFAPVSEVPDEGVLGAIAAAVQGLGRREGWGEGFVYRLNVVLDELASNIILHGRECGRPVPRITIRIRCRHPEVVVEVCDNGRPFDPSSDAPPPLILEAGASSVPVGGLGLHLVRSMVDTLSYRREDGRNRLTLTFRVR